MQYRFGKIDYYGSDGLKKTIPSIIHLGNASKYGIFFWSEVSHIDLEYAEEIVSSIEMLLRGEVDFYEGFGFEVYMIECDREKAVVKNAYEDDKVEAIIPIEEVYELMRVLARFSTRVLSQPYFIVEMVGYRASRI